MVAAAPCGATIVCLDMDERLRVERLIRNTRKEDRIIACGVGNTMAFKGRGASAVIFAQRLQWEMTDDERMEWADLERGSAILGHLALIDLTAGVLPKDNEGRRDFLRSLQPGDIIEVRGIGDREEILAMLASYGRSNRVHVVAPHKQPDVINIDKLVDDDHPMKELEGTW